MGILRTYAIIASCLLLLSLWLIYDSHTTNEDNLQALKDEMKRELLESQEAADSIAALYKHSLEQDTVQAILYRNALDRGDKAIERALKAENEVRIEKARNRKFTDAECDSLLSLVKER